MDGACARVFGRAGGALSPEASQPSAETEQRLQRCPGQQQQQQQHQERIGKHFRLHLPYKLISCTDWKSLRMQITFHLLKTNLFCAVCHLKAESFFDTIN
jgi:hypothetical protein